MIQKTKMLPTVLITGASKGCGKEQYFYLREKDIMLFELLEN